MSTVILDSAAAIQRAIAAIGTDDGLGACLANVYKWFGSVPSIGPGSGHYDKAIEGWNYAEYTWPGDRTPPPGVPVYFGIDTPRTDANAKAGDVVLSIGGGRVIATDSPTGRPGVMTIAARASQVRRNYLGWAADFLGHPVSGAMSYIAERDGSTPTITPPITVVKSIGDALPMYSLVPDAQSTTIQFVNLNTGRYTAIRNLGDFDVLKRIRANDGTDKILQVQYDILAWYVAQTDSAVANVQATANNIESIIAKDNGGGIRGVVDKIATKVGA